MALAARTRQRLTKYGVLQLRMLDLYTLKRVKIDKVHIKNNLKLQKGHAKEYEFMLRESNLDDKADKFIDKIRRETEETREAIDEMRAYVSQNVLNPSEMGQVVFWE